MAGTAAAAEPDEAAASGGEGLLLDAVFRGVEPSSLAAVQPFVSWHGVLVWAFAGWGPSLWCVFRGTRSERRGGPQGLTPAFRLSRAAKHALNGSALLAKEAYGSRWPKVTLGCLDADADLTRPEFEALRELCHRHRLDRPTALRLDEPRCVLYANRALEKLLLSTPLPAAAARAADAGPEPPAPESAAMVEGILAEMDGGDYWENHIRDSGGVRPNR